MNTLQIIFGITFLTVNILAIITMIFQAGQFKGSIDARINFLTEEVSDMKIEMRTFNEQCKDNILKGICQ